MSVDTPTGSHIRPQPDGEPWRGQQGKGLAVSQPGTLPARPVLEAPTLDSIALDPAKAAGLSLEVRAALIARCAATLAALAGPLLATPRGERAGLAARDDAEAPQCITIPELAERLKLAPGYLYALARRGELPVVRWGKYVRVPLDQLRAVLARLRSNPVDSEGYLTYPPANDRRGAPAAPKAAQANAASARRAGRGHTQHDRAPGTGRARDRGTARPAHPPAGPDGAQGTS